MDGELGNEQPSIEQLCKEARMLSNGTPLSAHLSAFRNYGGDTTTMSTWRTTRGCETWRDCIGCVKRDHGRPLWSVPRSAALRIMTLNQIASASESSITRHGIGRGIALVVATFCQKWVARTPFSIGRSSICPLVGTRVTLESTGKHCLRRDAEGCDGHRHLDPAARPRSRWRDEEPRSREAGNANVLPKKAKEAERSEHTSLS